MSEIHAWLTIWETDNATFVLTFTLNCTVFGNTSAAPETPFVKLKFGSALAGCPENVTGPGVWLAKTW